MFKIDGYDIHLTRGDSALIEVKAKNDDETNYTFKVNDILFISNFFGRSD